MVEGSPELQSDGVSSPQPKGRRLLLPIAALGVVLLLGIVAIGFLANVLYLRGVAPQAKNATLSQVPPAQSVATKPVNATTAVKTELPREDWPPEEQKLAVQKEVHKILQEWGGKWAHGIEMEFRRRPVFAEYNGPSCVIQGKRIPPDDEENLPWRLIFFQDVETKVWHPMYFYVDRKRVPEFRPSFPLHRLSPSRLTAPSGSKHEQ